MNLQWASVSPKKHRHVWGDRAWRLPLNMAIQELGVSASLEAVAPVLTDRCTICGRRRDELTSRRGRLNRKRGNAIELWACKLLGIRRVGQYGGLEDGGGSEDHLVIQVKSGGAFQQSLLAKIRSVPARSDQLRAWVTVSTPGAGRPREGVISFDLAEFAAWYGKGAPDDLG